MENLLTAKDVSHFLGLSMVSIYRLASDDTPEDERIPSFRIGKQNLRFKESDLLEWIAKRENKKSLEKPEVSKAQKERHGKR